MARHVVALKIAILRNKLRAGKNNSSRLLSILVGIGAVAYLAAEYGGGFLEGLRSVGTLVDPAEFTTMISFSLVLTWMVTPLAAGRRGGIELRNFQLLSIRPWDLVRGLGAAAFISPWPFITAAFVGVMVSQVSTTPAGWAVIVAALAVLVVLCVLVGQVMVALAGLISRSRRGREALVVLPFFVMVVPFLLFADLNRQFQDPAVESGLSDVLRWVPLAWPGWAMGEAANGDLGVAAAVVAASVAACVGLVAVWAWLVGWSLTSEDRSTARGHHAEPFAGFARRLPHDRRGAVAALELRLLFRQPARLMPVVVNTIMLGGVFTALTALALESVAPLGAFAVTIVISFRRNNEWGVDAPSLWMNVVAGGDPRDDLIGRDLAALVIDLPLVLIAGSAIAAISGDWAYLVPGWLFGFGAVLASYAGMRLIAVRMGRAEPTAKDGTDGPSQPNLVLLIIAMVTWMVLMAPLAVVLVPVVNGGPRWLLVAVPLALVYGAGLWWLSLREVGGWLRQNQSALLRALGA